MEPEVSLLHSQVPASCPYPEPFRCGHCPHIPFPEDPSYFPLQYRHILAIRRFYIHYFHLHSFEIFVWRASCCAEIICCNQWRSYVFDCRGRAIVMAALDRNYKLSKVQFYIEFPFICLGNPNFFGAENQVLSSSAMWPGAAEHLVPSHLLHWL